MEVKDMNVAGTFYPAHPEKLTEQVSAFLKRASKNSSKIDGHVRGIIVPHAGYIYSGQVAAYAFDVLAKEIKGRKAVGKIRIVILSPSHYYPFQGAATADYDGFRTPLGEVSSRSILREKGVVEGEIRNIPELFLKEHSLEVELPFLQTALEGTPFIILPLLIGESDPKVLADAIAPFAEDPDTYFVVSSDLSHFHTDEIARDKDLSLCQTVENLDFEKMGCGEACGKTGIETMMHLAKENGWRIDCLLYENSSATSGDFSKVVGYGAFVVYDETKPHE